MKKSKKPSWLYKSQILDLCFDVHCFSNCRQSYKNSLVNDILPSKLDSVSSYQWEKVSFSFTSLWLIVFRSLCFTHWFLFTHNRKSILTKESVCYICYLFQDIIRNIHISLHHPFPQRTHNHFIDATEPCLYCILFFSISVK
jgi:hypothetical protein